MSIQGQGSSSSTINGEPMVTTSLRSSPASAAPTAELLEESPSVASSIGLGSTPIPVEQPSYGGDGLLDTKLSYYRQLSRNMAPNMQTLLAPPPSILENAHQVLLLKQGGQAGSASIIFTLWNTMMGSTLLIMPYCFQQAGWLLSALLSIFAAVVSQYSCSLILRYGMHSLGPSAEFADLAYEHLGRAGWTAALAASLLVVLAAACAMHLYMAHSLTQLVTCAPRARLQPLRSRPHTLDRPHTAHPAGALLPCWTLPALPSCLRCAQIPSTAGASTWPAPPTSPPPSPR